MQQSSLKLFCFLVLGLFASGAQLVSYKDIPFEQFNQTQAYLYTEFTPLASWLELPNKWSKDSPIVTVNRIPDENAVYLQQDLTKVTGQQRLWRMNLQKLSATFTELALPAHVQHNFTSGSIFTTGLTNTSIVIATPNFVFSCSILADSTFDCPSASLPSHIKEIFSVQISIDNTLWLGTNAGLFFSDAENNFHQLDHVPSIPVTEVIINPTNQRVYCATERKLWYSYGNENQGNHELWNYYWIDGLIDGKITSLTYDNQGSLWIGNDICINVLHANLTFERIGPARGLPFTNITSISYDKHSNNLWVGSWTGVSRLESESSWNYYYGPRWIAGPSTTSGQNVSSVLGFTMNSRDENEQMIKTAIIVSDSGISIIMSSNWTLSEKAEHYQNMVYPRHDMYGLTADCSLVSYGSVTNWTNVNSDNDGLWTSMYLASQCFRYAVTKSPDAKKNAWNAFKGLSLLNKVTGIQGLPARTAFKGTIAPTGGEWFNSSSMPGWIWKGDTSADEITGHLMVYPIFHDLVCETEEERELPRNLLGNMTHYIVENDYYLIDVTGKPTTWGVWAPSQLNSNQTWYTQRGLNALQMLTWLLSAHRITGDDYYSVAFDQLAYRYGYAQNIINQKITDPMDLNFSDDELAFLPYLLYYWTSTNTIDHEMQMSIFRAWNQLQRENPSLWNFIYSMSEPGNGGFGLSGAVNTLKEWPISLINWPVDNSKRKDIHLQRELSRGGEFQAAELLPYDEISMYRWNGNPYQLGAQGSGYSEYDPGAWLMSYWLGVYLGHIV